MDRLAHVRRWVIWTGVVLLVIGAKLWLVDYAGSSVPRWDQIDAEGEVILRPWLNGELHAANFWQSHNEHRIVFTKLEALGLVMLNGQWDAYVQVFVNAVLHALLLPVLLAWIHRRVRGWPFAIVAVVTTALWLLPLAWENTVQGFQSQFYILIWLSFFHLRGVLSAERFNTAWWVGQLCGLLALGAMASGLLSSLAVLIITAAEIARSRTVNRLRIATIGLSLVWVVLGWLTRTPYPGHEPLHVKTLGEAFDGIAQVLTWPLQGALPYSLLAALPLAALAVVWFRQPERDGFQRSLLGLGVWFGLIAAALVYARYHGALLAPRYVDQFAIGLLLQGAALALLPMPKSLRIACFAGWVASLGFALQADVQHITSHTLPRQRQLIAKQEANTRAFLADPRPELLRDKGKFDLVYPHGEALWLRWQDPAIRDLLPGAVRPPVAIPTVPDAQTAHLPTPPYPVIATSPTGIQREPWIWQSERQPADTLPILRFRFSGQLGDPRAALTMRVVSDAWAVDVRPDGSAPNRWKTINVIRPPGEWWIELSDRDSAASVALTAPVEMGWFSWATEKAIKYHAWWIGIGGALLLAGLLGGQPARPRVTPPAA
ncbi:hypothetical protein [Actomonas aquatica]|uniref:Glycosyltransferase RgtA/B/C/D-like domain-containing protein n=1 Tax=Actomonas aquatica TaxID=2866162 RepID=A0ABZ1CAM0_9BACT|nr:hypothetical protein [Opitutus sp. WL0086]WRQ88516.1 hypothetical protein K1X11_003815 [Opitutus sp. WL0086]